MKDHAEVVGIRRWCDGLIRTPYSHFPLSSTGMPSMKRVDAARDGDRGVQQHTGFCTIQNFLSHDLDGRSSTGCEICVLSGCEHPYSTRHRSSLLKRQQHKTMHIRVVCVLLPLLQSIEYSDDREAVYPARHHRRIVRSI